MTKQEVKKLMAAIRAAWPGFYKGADEGTVRAATALWAAALADLRYEDAEMCIRDRGCAARA